VLLNKDLSFALRLSTIARVSTALNAAQCAIKNYLTFSFWRVLLASDACLAASSPSTLTFCLVYSL
jgi:hypothetical protein